MMWLAGTSKAYAPLALGLVTRSLKDRSPEQQAFTTSGKRDTLRKIYFPQYSLFMGLMSKSIGSIAMSRSGNLDKPT